MPRIKGLTILFSVLFLSALSPVAAQERPTMESFGIESIDLHLEITSLREASAPRLIEGDKVLFTYLPSSTGIAGPRRTRYVGIAFEHENFSTVHVFAKNAHGVFFFLYPLTSDGQSRTLRYRYVVDGLWLADPENPVRTEDVGGIAVSSITVTTSRPDRGELPRIEGNNRVLFVYRGDEGGAVYVAGSFSNWDPYMHRLREVAPGEYRARLRLPPATYAYYFVVDGRRVLDEFNPDRAYDRDGNAASRLVVPPGLAMSAE
jgi:hypothetical protein